ncbi:solute carrier family 23 member 3 [Hemiscyllium ocellatum]|uniref:solute carrier family 23 member 3 n=1 Tax=Hemiscyllium ocellatum TaxID=170820 RepID=UPI002966A550|nr:solute carrier family 23 member 3 [Hemiscyllium ocellatum]
MEDYRSTEQSPKKEAEVARFPFQRQPPWILSFLFAVQHVLVQTALLQTVHCLLIDALPSDQTARQHGYQFMATSLFASGISTLLQTTLGSRLPLVQAPSFEYLIPAITLVSSPTETNSSHHNVSLDQGQRGRSLNTSRSQSSSCWSFTASGTEPHTPERSHLPSLVSASWVRGAIVVSGILQAFLGFSGLQGLVFRRCGPMVLAPMLSIIGLSCYKEVAHFSSLHWGVTALLVLQVMLLSQHLCSCHIPICRWKRSKGFVVETYFPLFRIFSVWIADFPSGAMGFKGKGSPELLPGEWGAPTINVRSTYIGVIMALGTSIGSLGCYVMCAKVMGCLHPPRDAVNRGIFLEGLGSCIGAFLGGITATSSSVVNVGALALTQAESRHSVQIAAVLCILLGMSAKLTYILTTIPAAVHGGVLSVTYTMAVSVGISYFQYTNIDSGRNIFIIGFTMFMALLTPHWFIRNPDYIVTGVESVDIFLMAVFMMPVIQGGILAFLLDNTVTGELANIKKT